MLNALRVDLLSKPIYTGCTPLTENTSDNRSVVRGTELYPNHESSARVIPSVDNPNWSRPVVLS